MSVDGVYQMASMRCFHRNPDCGRWLFPDGERHVHAETCWAFVTLIPWNGSSSLHNSGETLRLIRPDGTKGDHVTYSDTDGWTNEADGSGASLEWKGPGWDNAAPEAWVGSNALGGSPGMDNSTWAD